MSEERVRELVREEIAAQERETAERRAAMMREFALRQIDDNQPSDDDGPLVARLKGIFREAANDSLGKA